MQSIPSIVTILWRYKQNEELSEPELDALEQWLKSSQRNQELFDDLSNEAKWDKEIAALQAKESNATWNKISRRVEEIGLPVKKNIHWWRYAAAASVVVLIVSASYMFLHQYRTVDNTEISSQKERYQNDIQPGRNNTILKLANGAVITLDSSRSGMIAKQGNTSIVNDSGQLVFKSDRAATKSGSTMEDNILSTPKGGQYQVALPDGSRVWLNAVSTLRFPTAFPDSVRTVELNGEAYFEITRNIEKPFIVKTEQASIRVLGTHFNINAYSNEPATHTTLMEGSVALSTESSHIILKPGEVASVNREGVVNVGKADVQQAVAWRDKLFWFQDATYEQIMRQISRWYNIDVDFKNPVKERFTGILPNNLPISTLLSSLEKEGHASFTIDGNKVIVRAE